MNNIISYNYDKCKVLYIAVIDKENKSLISPDVNDSVSKFLIYVV